MTFNLSTEHIKPGEKDLELLEEKILRLEKLLRPPYLIDVRLTHDRHHRQGKVITCRLNIKQGGEVFHSERAADTVQNAVDLTVAAAKNELQKYRDKLKPGPNNK